VRSIYLRDRKSIIHGACGSAIYFVCLLGFVGFVLCEWLLGSGKTAGEVGDKLKIIERTHNPNGVITSGFLPNSFPSVLFVVRGPCFHYEVILHWGILSMGRI
jgi:hypothetical protein